MGRIDLQKYRIESIRNFNYNCCNLIDNQAIFDPESS